MGEKKKKPQKLKARLPRGFADRSPEDIRATDEMVANIRKVYELYGFDPVETPMFEYTDALGKFLPDSDRPNEGVFSLTDDDDQWMSLRYDLTAPLARHVAENFNTIQLPYRTYRAGWVFRNEKPGPGRFRQFMQFDADTVGAPGVQADAEMCMMMADTMEALGIGRGDYVIRVNNRKVLDGVMETIGISGDDHADTRLSVLRAIDKLDKFGVEGVRLLLGDGRKDESGDFTKGAGLDKAAIDRVIGFVEAAGANGAETIGNLTATVGDGSARGVEGISELSQMASLFAAADYDDTRIKIDPSVVRGLEYYTGPVYEAELLFDVTNEKGISVQFGSVGGGGRYDGLVSRFMGQPVPATGFSIGVSRLMTALKNLGKLGQDDVAAPIIVCVMDRDTQSMGHYQRFVSALRKAGIRAEMYQGNPKNFGKQLQYADRRGSPIAIIQGSQEREEGTVQIKDLLEGKRLSGEIEDNAAWRAERPAQISVPEDDLVGEVQKILAIQAGDRKAH
ncbi:MAG: histidine--tRNA ligase [Rhizobiaceae bacterium]|nr:histidine--tRNA ligase [Rhizobiaceae bacterium]|tara:strand:+ start:50609 stop:52129 length:1521 start_codon:yes stop_codon:yes gene_type:complete